MSGAITALVVLTAINFVCLYDRVQLSALVQPIKEEFHFSDTQMGLVSGTAFGLTYAAAAIPLGWLSDRGHRIRLLAMALTFWSLMTGATAFAKSFTQFMLCRVGVAAGESAFTPTAHSLLSDYFPPERRGFVIGVETAGSAAGIMVGLAMAGWLAAAFGWRGALLASVVPGLLLALFTVTRVREPVRTHIAMAVETSPLPLSKRVTSAYIWLLIAAVGNSTMSTGWTQWLPAFFMRSHHLPLKVVGASIGLATGLGGLIGVIVGGWLSAQAARRGARTPFLWCALIALGTLPGYATAIWSPNTATGLFGVFESWFGAAMMQPFIFSSIQSSCDPRFRARAVALTLAFVTVGSYALMPVVIGGLSDAFAPEYGKQSLKLALNAFLIVPLLVAFVFVLAARTFHVWAVADVPAAAVPRHA